MDVDQQVFGAGAGIRVDYTFTAITSHRFIFFTPLGGGTWHHHAVALRTETPAAPQAVVLNTDGAPLPGALVEAIYTRHGIAVAIDEIGPRGIQRYFPRGHLRCRAGGDG